MKSCFHPTLPPCEVSSTKPRSRKGVFKIQSWENELRCHVESDTKLQDQHFGNADVLRYRLLISHVAAVLKSWAMVKGRCEGSADCFETV